MHKRLRVWRVLVSLQALTLFALPLVTPRLAGADSYNVTAQVNAPLPPEVPVVTSPDNNTIITTQAADEAEIIGTCPVVVPSLIVVLIRAGETVGTGQCTQQGNFSIKVGLVLGQNIFLPKFVTVTGQSSGFGAPLTLTYSPVVITEPSQGSGSTTDSGTKPTTPNAPASGQGVKIVLPYDFVTYKTKKQLSLTFEIQGGTPPYTVIMQWGDGLTKQFSYSEAGTKTVTHIYSVLTDESKKIVALVRDKNGDTYRTERALITYEQAGFSDVASQPLATAQRNFYLIWGSAAVACLILVLINYNRLVSVGHTLIKFNRRRLVGAKRNKKGARR